MSSEPPIIRVGQFSESPVLAVARALGLDQKYGIDWSTERVASSPGQFQSLADGEIDIAITSPDNVLLYATTDQNPLKTQLNLSFLRTIDRGLGLALYTSDQVQSPHQLRGGRLGVDVPNSGFAFLLFAMLEKLGVPRSDYELESVGATPKRLAAITEGLVSGTILNAETAVAAQQEGLPRWSTSVDVSEDYLGTVLVALASVDSGIRSKFLELWEEATQVILSSQAEELSRLLSNQPKLASSEYLSILKSTEFGLLQDPVVNKNQLMVLAGIRSQFGAYEPSVDSIDKLLAG